MLLVLVACAAPKPPPAKPFAMRTYIFVLLRRGPAWSPEETPESKKLFEGHMANIMAMAKSKKLVIAGPFDAPKDQADAYAGMFVFDVATDAEVQALLANDPAIAAGRLVPELRTWHGPVGLTYDGQAEITR